MKNLIVVTLFSSIGSFANELPIVIENYGPELTIYSFKYDANEDKAFEVSDDQPGGDYSIRVKCAEHLKDALKSAPVENGIHAILIKKAIGATSGVCLVKARLNY